MGYSNDLTANNFILTGEALNNMIRKYGPDEALQALITNFGENLCKRILNYLKYNRCPDAFSHVEDIQQETYSKALVDMKKYSDGLKIVGYRQPFSWLSTIGRNESLSHLIKERLELTIQVFDLTDEEIDYRRSSYSETSQPFGNSVEAQYYQNELLHFVREVFTELPQQKQDVLRMVMNGFTHKEIARRLNITPEFSRQEALRGLRIMRRKLLSIDGGE
ncbi:MAG TPA: sigma-70 family RNA polymerase sigma factor [Pedobacter sp.]|jgi:RNA polymerase sigma factor (sigma-70 family)